MSNQATAPAVKAPTSTLEFPAASPLATTKQRVGLTDIEATYSRPAVKGRHIFGGLVPYDKLWRAGANQATKISFSSAVKLNGTDIAAGAYAVLAIPGKEEWIIIINKDTEQSGIGKYDEKADVARLTVKSTQLKDTVENYSIEIEPVSDQSATIDFLWEKTKVSLKLEIEFIKELVAKVEETMASDAAQKPYFQAALLYFNHNQDLNKASKWVDAAIAERPIYPFHLVKAKILAKLGDKQGALKAAEESKESATQMNDLGFVKMTEDFLATLK